jgi:hypothetical protein
LISDKAAQDAGCAFNFSRPQWEAILGAVGEGCLNPFDFRILHLLEEANLYLRALPQHQPPSKRANALKQRAKAALALRKMVMETDRGEDFAWIFDEREFSILLNLLDRFELHVRFAAEDLNDPSSPNHPRMKFYHVIFGLWVEAGGALRRSRKSDQEPTGPLVRFVQAITRPVMGNDAPKPETILDLIYDTRKFFSDDLGMALNDEGRSVSLYDYNLLTPVGLMRARYALRAGLGEKRLFLERPVEFKRLKL